MALNFDALAFFRFFVALVAAETDPDGSVPDVVPFQRYGGRPGDVSWTAALPHLALVAGTIGGDWSVAKDNFEAILAQLSNVRAQAAPGLAAMHTPYGDWCPPPPQLGGGQGPKPSPPYTSAFSYVSGALPLTAPLQALPRCKPRPPAPASALAVRCFIHPVR